MSNNIDHIKKQVSDIVSRELNRIKPNEKDLKTKIKDLADTNNVEIAFFYPIEPTKIQTAEDFMKHIEIFPNKS